MVWSSSSDLLADAKKFFQMRQMSTAGVDERAVSARARLYDGKRMSPEKRKDPIPDRWLIRAEGRANRSSAGTPEVPFARDACSFLKGQEGETGAPGETEPNTVGWRIRVVPNLYPTLSPRFEPQPYHDGCRVTEKST